MKITLTNGSICLIDDEDYDLLSKYKWRLNDQGYILSEKVGRIHRVIMKAKEGQLVDHINCDRLDNRKSNLRFCTKSQNGMNRGAQSNSKTGLKGICKEKRPSYKNKIWRVTINKLGKQIHVGYFRSIEEAKTAYQKAAILYHGEFART